jgi:hypothetical protein
VVRGAEAHFHSADYLRHNARRLEHLASLRIPLAGASVLELGAGIGDHSHYFLDRGCRLTITEPRLENLALLRARYPGVEVKSLDLERPGAPPPARYDVVYCYGLLYHLGDPSPALDYMSSCCDRLLLLETCVSFGDEALPHPVWENFLNPTQAASGAGCRPTRRWLFERLRSRFPFVYIPRTQPHHEEFPLDWERPELHQARLSRAVFVASRQPIDNPLLSAELLSRQSRHE